jgi:hypothetical protein
MAVVVVEAIVAAVVVEVPTAVAVAVVEVPMAAEAGAPTAEVLLLTVATTNLIAIEMARPDIPGGPFSFRSPQRT